VTGADIFSGREWGRETGLNAAEAPRPQ